MPLRNRIACWFCAWRTRRNEMLAEKYAERACTWSDRHLHFAIRELDEGKPNAADVSEPPFLPPLEQRAREAGA
jgi:hypothetical protein